MESGRPCPGLTLPRHVRQACERRSLAPLATPDVMESGRPCPGLTHPRHARLACERLPGVRVSTPDVVVSQSR
jgi:hypothetical protein